MLKNYSLKKTGLVILTMIGIAFLPAVSHAVYPEDIISHWSLDETGFNPGDADGVYVDSFGTNDGTTTFNPTEDVGIVGGAQLFDGANTKINVPADISFDWQADDSFSIEFWMKTDSGIPGSNQVIIGRADDAAAAPPELFWWVGIRGGTGLAAFTLRDTDRVGSSIPGGGTVNLADGDWHHVVAIRDTVQDKIILYVDGATDPTLQATDETLAGFDGQRSLYIGWLNNGAGFFFDGLIDEVALYDRVLSPAEITSHYNSGLAGAGVESLPVADAGVDQTVQDNVTVTLDGSNSDDPPVGTIASYLWEQVGTPAVVLSGATNVTATFTAPDVSAATILTFQLTVTDNDGATDTDTVNITVNDSGVAPVAPVATGGGGGGGCFINTLF
jgi:hypothetical protein